MSPTNRETNRKRLGRANRPKSEEPRQRASRLAGSQTGGRVAIAWTGVIFLVHITGLIFLFDSFEGIANGEPLIDQDWGLHFHHLRSMETFWREHGGLWGYNPLFMAGYPSNTIQDLSVKFFELSALMLSSVALTPIQWFKLLALLAVASVPWLAYFTARNFWDQTDLQTIAPPIAALLGTAYWWNSLPREMLFYGMLGFPLACYLVTWGLSLAHRMANQPAAWSTATLGWLLFSLMIPSIHVQAVIVFIPPLAALLFVQPELLRTRFLFWLLGAAGFSLIANLIWLAPAVSHLKDDVSRNIVEQVSLFISSDPLTFLKDYVGPKRYWSFRATWLEKGLRLMLLALGIFGTVKLIRSEQRSAGVMLAVALATLFFVSYFGSLLPLTKGWQPMRFKVAFDLFLALGAAYVVASHVVRRSMLPSPVLVLALMIGGTAFLFNVAVTESAGKMRLRTQIHLEITAIADWIKTESPVNGRVLFEESGDETGFVYNGMYLSSFAAHWSGREFIGGPINLYNDRHHFAEFHSGKLFKQEIHRLGDEEIRKYFDLYNIGAVVAFHPASIQRLQSVPGLVSVDRRIGPVHLMKVNRPLSWFIRGGGNVHVALGRVTVTNAIDGELILKYHWVEGLKGIPEVKMAPVKMQDDPIPFIRILDPPEAFSLQIGK